VVIETATKETKMNYYEGNANNNPWRDDRPKIEVYVNGEFKGSYYRRVTKKGTVSIRGVTYQIKMEDGCNRVYATR
jgi:hypothetical protein